MKRRRIAPSAPTAVQRHRTETENARVESALRARRFRSFEGFVARHSSLTIVQMADALGVPRIVFISYHARWVRENAKAVPDAGRA